MRRKANSLSASGTIRSGPGGGFSRASGSRDSNRVVTTARGTERARTDPDHRPRLPVRTASSRMRYGRARRQWECCNGPNCSTKTRKRIVCVKRGTLRLATNAGAIDVARTRRHRRASSLPSASKLSLHDKKLMIGTERCVQYASARPTVHEELPCEPKTEGTSGTRQRCTGER